MVHLQSHRRKSVNTQITRALTIETSITGTYD